MRTPWGGLGRGIAATAAIAAALGFAPAAEAAGPPPLSAEPAPAVADSTAGSGAFGRWGLDRFGLPLYRYTLDQDTDPRGVLPEIGRRDNWSQLGNDAIVADAFNHGYTQLWSQARLPQWANRHDAASRHYAGGFGYLRGADGTITSTLWSDRAPGSRFRRWFGVGYARKSLRAGPIAIRETTTAPWGDDPALVHEIRLTNTTGRPQLATWWEYWDVNPYDELANANRGVESPAFDDARDTLTARQQPNELDDDPLTIFLASAGAEVQGFEADTESFFGAGDRARPAAVADDTADGAIAPASPEGTPGRAMFALRTPVTLGSHETVTLRYVYGIAHAEEIGAITDRAGRRGWAKTAGRWAAWVPRADLGARRAWLSRELAWDAYMVRSSTVYEEVCGHHVITQGGYYQYGGGQQIAFRDPLQHALPMIYAEPELAREVLRYSFQQQPPDTGALPYGMGPMCTRLDIGTSNDLDFWLLLTLSEYVLATRDVGFLDEEIPYRGGLPGDGLASGSLWDHVKLAVRHQETLPGRGPAGHYVMGATGDWSDFSTLAFGGATESVLVTAQLAYLYPRLADVAELRGDQEFADELRELGRQDLELMRGEWVGPGWYSRAYRGLERIGVGAIYLEPQPWAVLAGAPDAAQAGSLVGNIERFLQGVGAPAELGGPTRIGTSQSPARNDPGITETDSVQGVGDNNAVFVGGVWYSLNGPLTWALGALDGVVPGAARKALDELERNTLTAHASAFPDHWAGILHVDDACNSFYASAPDQCGIPLLYGQHPYTGQIAHQPAWSLFSALRLAGVEPTRDGYSIAPSLPLRRYELRLPRVGIEVRRRELRGYIETESSGPIHLELAPRGAPATGAARLYIDGRRERGARLEDGKVVVDAAAGRDRVIDFSLIAPRGGPPR